VSSTTEAVLVTGGCGFIGANVVRALRARGLFVRVIDDLSTGDRRFLDDIDVELLIGDVLDADTFARAVAGCSYVVHLAARTSVLGSVSDPEPTFRVNALGTLRALQAARDAQVRRFVFASSNAAVGSATVPVTETVVPQPASPYGASKLAGEGCCSAFHRAYGLETVRLRFANVYGPFSDRKTSFVAKAIGRLIRGEALQIYGDGLQTRDFIRATDVASAVVASLDVPSIGGEVFCIGTGVETSIVRLLAELEHVSGIKPRLDWVPQPPGEVRRSFSDITRARAVLGFSPTVGLSSGLARTFEWLSTQHSAAKTIGA
jgi:UDP-glucose 4-epimerase